VSKKTLLFSQYNKITRAIYWALKEKVTRAEIIDTNIKESKRQQFLKDFEEGQYNVLLSSRIFEEGYNLPQIDQAIFLSSNSTSRQMIQRLGRILRKKEVSSDAYYIYCIDTFEEDYAMRAKEFVQDVAEKVYEEEY
jgi:superfamily II DNA or RNA helicase